MITRQGVRIYRDVLDKRIDPRGKPYYWIAGEPPSGIKEDGTDFGALAEGYISITPLKMDMTDFALLEKMKKESTLLIWQFFPNEGRFWFVYHVPH